MRSERARPTGNGTVGRARCRRVFQSPERTCTHENEKAHFPHPHRGAGAVRLCVGVGFRNHSHARGDCRRHTGTDGGIVTSRIVSDYPIPLPSDSEMLSAILQNSTYEFDLTDPATGRPIQKIFEYPCDGTPEGDGYITYTYAGKNGSDFYFIAYHMTPSYWTGSSVLCIHSDGTQEDLGIMTAQKFIRPMHQNEALRWFMVPNDDIPRTYTFYDLQGNEIGHNAAPAGVDVALIMEYLLDDGRVVLTLGGDPAHNYAANYATIPADAFLNGSTEYTEMEFVG